MQLLNNRPQMMTSKRGEHKKMAHETIAEGVNDVPVKLILTFSIIIKIIIIICDQ